MHSTILLLIALCLTTGVFSGTTVSNVCDEHLTTNCISATSIIGGTIVSSLLSQKHHTITTTTNSSSSHHRSNHSSTSTMPTLTTSIASYTNSSTITSHITPNSNSLPTSIIVATGTPTPPTILPSTITSFTIVPPASASPTLAPTTQSSAIRDGKVVRLSGLALVVLAVSALVLL